MTDITPATIDPSGDETESVVIRTYIGNDKNISYVMQTQRHHPDHIIRTFVNGREVTETTKVTRSTSANPALSGQSTVTFAEPAPIGAQVIIVTESPIIQDQSWRPFGPFEAEKTEITLDRLIILKQEMALFRANANLFWTADAYTVTLISDKGDDVVMTVWNNSEAGVFAGEAADSVPFDNAVVDKPANFLYMLWDNSTNPNDIVWDSFIWTVDYSAANPASLIQSTATGRAYLSTDIFGPGSATPFLDNWHRNAPLTEDPTDFQVKLDVLSGSNPTGDAVGVWLNAEDAPSWTFSGAGTWQVELSYTKEPDPNPDSGSRIINIVQAVS